MKFLVMLIGFLLFGAYLFGAQDFPVDFTYPSFSGDFYVSGSISFPPGAVKSEKNIIVKTYDLTKEVPTKINIVRKWANESVLSAEIVFVANSSRREKYMLSYGDEVERRKIFQETAVLPIISFSIGGAPKTSEKVDIDVGRINVRVDKSPGIRYYWYIVPIVILVLLSCYRSRRRKRFYES